MAGSINLESRKTYPHVALTSLDAMNLPYKFSTPHFRSVRTGEIPLQKYYFRFFVFASFVLPNKNFIRKVCL